MIVFYHFKSFFLCVASMFKYTKLNTDLSLLVIYVQGIENIRNEIQDTMEPLIDPVHGHGRYKNTSLHQLSSSVRPIQELVHYWKVLFCVVKGTAYLVFSQKLLMSPFLSVFSVRAW